MRINLKVALIAAVLASLSVPAIAENCLLGPCKKADLPTCGSKLKGRNFDVTNCVSAISCSTTASPGFAVRMVCDYTGSAWAYRAVNATAGASDLTGYAELASATSTAFAPGTDFTVTPVAGSSTINAVGATKDVSLVAADDIFLTPADALVAVAGGNTTITSTAGTVAIASSAGAVTITAVGATNDVTTNAADDIINAATDDHVNTGDNFGVTTTTATINPGGSTVELQMSAGVSTFLGSLILPISAAPPVACAAGSKGTVYYDSDTNLLCVCDSTGYVQIADGTTGCS